MPFTPSHVEARTPDGGFFIGAHLLGGVRRRPVGYDKGSIAKLSEGYDETAFPGGLCDFVLSLPAEPGQEKAFYDFLEGHLGEPYDWKAIPGFLVPEHLHLSNHAICSALQTLALRTPSCEWFKFRLAAPAHLIDPRDLLLMLSTHVQIPGV